MDDANIQEGSSAHGPLALSRLWGEISLATTRCGSLRSLGLAQLTTSCSSTSCWTRRQATGSLPSRSARPSDALNLAALVQAPIFVAPEVLQETEARRAGDSPTAARLRRALAAPPMTVGTVGM